MVEVKERDLIGFGGLIQRALVGKGGRCFGINWGER
jgi:hypothetical protein